MNRNRVFRTHQSVDQLDLFLTCMAGYVGILIDYFGALHGQFVDNLGHGLLIAGNRSGAEHYHIGRFNRYLFVGASRHTGKGRHGFSLASCGDEHGLLVRIILQLVDIN